MPTRPAMRGTSRSLRPESVLVRTRSTPALLLVLAQLGEHRVVLERGGVADRLLAGGDVAQEAPHDLAASRLRQGIREADVVGAGGGADLLGDLLLERLL